MFKDVIEDLFSLFAVMVVADKKVYAVEIDAFTKAIVDFFQRTDLGEAPSEAELLEWFDLNREKITEKLTEDSFETWFDARMSSVSKTYSMRAVLRVMKKIASSDNEVHISETALLVLVDRYELQAA